ncbi:MAG: hypothetical protein FK730_15330 [Asgard group archaeon]|nr:hypothetical protein [Asgard group archaeon]
MVPKKAKFQLDENLDVKLAKSLTTLGLSCSTLRSKGWTGIRNSDLSHKVKQNDLVLITADKDFTFLWDKYKIKVIYVSIHPKILSVIEPKLVSLFKS